MSDELQKELEHVRRTLQTERSHWEQERGQYQRRITELSSQLVTLGAPLESASEQKKEIVARVKALRKELAGPVPQAERNALAMELARLEPLAL